MVTKQETLRPQDVAVALQLVLTPEAAYLELSSSVGLSTGEVHNAVGRLRRARLLFAEGRSVIIPSLQDFISYGVPYAFPAELGAETRGVPTAYSAPPLSDSFGAADPVIWPSVEGTVRGQSLVPLLPSAPTLARSNPVLHRLLALVDALRIGRARERNQAKAFLDQALREGTI